MGENLTSGLIAIEIRELSVGLVFYKQIDGGRHGNFQENAVNRQFAVGQQYLAEFTATESEPYTLKPIQ